MKRRDFLKKGTIVAGLASSPNLIAPLIAQPSATEKAPQPQHPAGAKPEEIRSSEFLRRELAAKDLPKPPVFAASYLSANTAASPMPLAERLRRNIVPRSGFCSLAPGRTTSEGVTSGNGPIVIEVACDPYSEQVLFHHESLLMPWKRPLEAPKVADILPQVRQMVLDGKYREAAEFALKTMNEGPIKINTFAHPTIPAFMMHLDSPGAPAVSNYLRTVDFESSEVRVYWTDERGDWVRRAFVSRPDNVVVQWLSAPAGQQVNARIALERGGRRIGTGSGSTGLPPGQTLARAASGNGTSDVEQDFTTDRLIYKCRLDPSTDNSGYAGVVRVVRDGGSARMDGDVLVIENASSVVFLTRIEWFADFSEDKVETLRLAVEQLPTGYEALLERHRKVQSEMFNRVTVDFGGDSQFGLATEELLDDQRSRPDYSPALLEKIFQMGRYWFIYTSGKYPTMVAEVNINVNLQIAPGPQGDLREGMNAYFDWMESIAPDCRVNARNIFGCRGTSYPLLPDKGIGVSYHYAVAGPNGEIWPHPYWISAGGWCYRPFWDHYLTTGDLEFLRNRIVPGLKELALFYEDFLTLTDKQGNYMFIPSFSPENWPGNTNPPGPLVLNSTMDISVCREVLNNLIDACEVLGSDADSIPKWKAMLAKLPPYMMEPDGTLKEWAWPTLEEHYPHRHISHLYGAWPGDDIDPDRTPTLALAAMLADRKRVPERLAAHGRCHRALVGARLKDCFMVDTELRQLIEQGYVAPTLRCSHDPWAWPEPDAQGGIPTIMMEMLLYSRPGVIEVLPALPPDLVKGSISGMLARTFARIDKLAWDMDSKAVELTVTSFRKQDVTLIARYGIENISAPAGVLAAQLHPGEANIDVHLPENKQVTFRLRLGHHRPIDWVDQVASA
ncbi:MAG TPA: glycoside hydrolase N-terminal domain-containing protein [Terracidiphilus sp.]|nr:glycoside hydrolase N-terminal domain-containing protein [Terracidiphilus sp.]